MKSRLVKYWARSVGQRATIKNLKHQVSKLECENKKLKEQFLQASTQNYCKICGKTLDGYVRHKV